MLISGCNETIDQLAVADSVFVWSCVEEGWGSHVKRRELKVEGDMEEGC